MKGFEPFWYETSPYIYILVGVFAILASDTLSKVFGIVLLTAAATIIGMRISYRRIELANKRARMKASWR
jgi:multisubunit Na+/H+ antiporter MnhC subunit